MYATRQSITEVDDAFDEAVDASTKLLIVSNTTLDGFRCREAFQRILLRARVVVLIYDTERKRKRELLTDTLYVVRPDDLGVFEHEEREGIVQASQRAPDTRDAQDLRALCAMGYSRESAFRVVNATKQMRLLRSRR